MIKDLKAEFNLVGRPINLTVSFTKEDEEEVGIKEVENEVSSDGDIFVLESTKKDSNGEILSAFYQRKEPVKYYSVVTHSKVAPYVDVYGFGFGEKEEVELMLKNVISYNTNQELSQEEQVELITKDGSINSETIISEISERWFLENISSEDVPERLNSSGLYWEPNKQVTFD